MEWKDIEGRERECVFISDVFSCYLNVPFRCFCFVASECGAVINEEKTRGSFMVELVKRTVNSLLILSFASF